MRPPHLRQTVMSMANTRAKRRAQPSSVLPFVEPLLRVYEAGGLHLV